MKNFFTQIDIDTSRQTGQRGFSLIETIVAMTVLLVSISGIMNLIHQGSVANRQQADQITATYLAAEAIEFMRADRDGYWLQTGGGDGFNDWINAGDVQTCSSYGGCQIDARIGNDDIVPCGGGCDPLDYNSSTGEYGYETGGNWEDSRFTRSVEIDLENNTGSIDEAEITVTVSWEAAGSSDNSITMQQSIYDYRGN